MASGSVLWGFIAEHTTTPKALTASAAGLLITLPFVHRYKILRGEAPDHTPYQWRRPAPALSPAPVPAGEDPDHTDGPVRISVEYIVPIHHYAEFTHAIHQLSGVRLRDGAIRWGIFRDVTDPTRLNETFVMESWLDYLRSRERVTIADREIQDRVRALHHDPATPPGSEPLPPKVTYQLYAREVANPQSQSS